MADPTRNVPVRLRPAPFEIPRDDRRDTAPRAGVMSPPRERPLSSYMNGDVYQIIRQEYHRATKEGQHGVSGDFGEAGWPKQSDAL